MKNTPLRTTFTARQLALAQLCTVKKTDAFLVTHMPHIRGLTGFSGSTAFLLATAQGYTFFTDFRYTEQAHKELTSCPHTPIIIIENDYWDSLSAHLKKTGVKTLGFDQSRLTFRQYGLLRKKAPNTIPQPHDRICEEMLACKSHWETGRMEKAAHIADLLFTRIKQWCRKGKKESDIAALLEYEARSMGAEGMSFPSIIAGAKNSSLPHAGVSSRTIRDGDIVLCDYGIKYKGYSSDMTRTLHCGKAPGWFREIYGVTLEAQSASLAVIKPGTACSEVDRAGRSVIEKAGYGRQFGHALGHGVGIDVHEEPRISKTATGELKEGMVITVEPGIYIPGKGGVRIEDMVVVTKNGYRNLVRSPKELIEL